MTADASGARELALEHICSELDLVIGSDQLSALARFVDLLERWNRVYNLTAVRNTDAMVSHHLADCLATVPALRRQMLNGRLLDVGSGGGLPGVVIAVLLPDVQVVCVDAVAKKIAFIQQVAGALALPNLSAHHARVEQLVAGTFDVITARAFASLSVFCERTRHHLSSQGVWMAMKGRAPDAEIGELPPAVEVFHVEQLAVPGLDAHRCLVWMRDRSAPARSTGQE